ncbi:MAG: hypothetical protein KFF77_01320 [Bacteroidetes bacterium]|nr:hypothetical protein [Bacteroidota bacterium]
MFRTLYLLICLCLLPPVIAEAQPCPTPDAAGPFAAGWQAVTVQRGGRTLNCRLFYPAQSAGQNTTVLTNGAPYPMIAFGHGFFMQTSYYTSYYEHLASRGYIVIAPQFPDTQHGELALDLLACIEYLRQSGISSSHFLFGVVDTAKAGLSGHSMGGGASLLAASYDSRILAVAPMCPAETTPSCINRMDQISGGVCIIAGSADGITSVAVHQQPMYRAAMPFKSLAVLQGGNHTRCMDVSAFDWTDPNGTMSRSQQQALTRRYMTAAFDYHIKGDSCGGSFSYGSNATHADVQLSFVTGPAWPVELGELSIQRNGSDVRLRWTTESETENFGFKVFRSFDAKHYEEIGFVFGAGSSLERNSYAYIDRNRKESWYRLRQIDFDGGSTDLPVLYAAPAPSTPDIYPTSFRSGTHVTLSIESEARLIEYTLFGLDGKRVAQTFLRPEEQHNGIVQLPPLSPGKYFLTLVLDRGMYTRSLLAF